MWCETSSRACSANTIDHHTVAIMDGRQTPPGNSSRLPSYRTRCLIVGSVAVSAGHRFTALTLPATSSPSARGRGREASGKPVSCCSNDGYGRAVPGTTGTDDFLRRLQTDQQRQLEVGWRSRVDSAFSRLAEDSASGPSPDNAKITLAP